MGWKKLGGLACGVCLAAVLAPSVAAAQSRPNTHDGFYFSGQLGGGYLSASASAGGTDVKVYGGAANLALFFGGSLSPGLVLGGGLTSAVAVGPKFELSGGGRTVEGDADDDTSLNFSTIGPFVSYYPDPQSGLHIDGMVGFASLNSSNGNYQSDSATGFSLAAAVGYDFWVAEQWSIGVLGRFTYSSVSEDDVDYSVISPALLVGFTFH